MKHFYQILLILLTLSGSADAQTTVNFAYTGAVQTWTVPPGVFALNITAQGAAGSNIVSSGGGGGVVKATLAVTSGQILNIYVGGKNDGYNGGGQLPTNKKGGGATDIRIGGTILTDRVLVAGGGGSTGSGGGGGNGGGTTGGTSTLGFNNGGGGTQLAGGVGGGGASSGTLGFGGDGGTNGAGGGGGYYGGGGSQSAGGGGGSSYTNSSCTAVTHTQGQNTGSNGYLAITYTPPPPGAALSFDGTDDYAVVPNNSAFNIAQFSIETWLKWDRTAANIDFVCSKGFEQMEIHLNTNNSIRFIPTIGVILDAPAGTMPLGAWTHIACVYDPSGTGWAKMYIDGVEVALTNNGPNPITSPLINNNSPFYFGTRSPGYLLLQGQMDDIRIWNRALCQSEILVHKNCELAANEVGLVAYYKANQGTSFSPNTSITTLTDATSNALNATLTNFGLTSTNSNFVALGGVTTGTACSPLTFVEINLQSNSTNIANGSTTFSTTNNTDFGNISTLSLAKIYTIQNTGTGALSISSVTSSNASFAISGAPTTVAAGGSATFTVTFAPTAVGSQTATITVNNNDCNEGVYDFAVKCTALCASATLYVDANVTASGAGTSWATAYKTFDEALAISQNCLVVTRINVAKGTYKPTKKPYDNGVEIVTSNVRDVTFHIRSGLMVAGGYPNGGGTQNIANNETIFSGDIGTVGDIADNTYHVVIASAGTGDAIAIDGFTISDGNAGDIAGSAIMANNTYYRNFGGGLYAIGGTNIITNNTITNNITVGYGGGMVLSGFDISATVNNNTFTNNNANLSGGAAFSSENYQNTISYNNNIFVGNSINTAGGGIAIDIYSGVHTFTNNIISLNTSTSSSAAIYVNSATTTFTNNTIVGNTSQGDAGATQFISSTATLKNNIFRANTAAGNSSDILSNISTLTFINNSMQNAASTYPLAAGSAGNIFEVNPLFVNQASPAGADGIYRTADDGLQLACGSPAINTGTNTDAPALDILGNAIVGTTKDMGAYEQQTDCANTIYSGTSTCKSYTIDNVSGTNWFDIYGDNGIIASIRPNQNLGNVTLTIGDPAGTSSYNNNLFIGKDINITSTIAPTVGTNYDLKLYYYDTEFDTYKTAINMPSATITDLNMAWAKGGTGCTLAAYASTATSNGTVNKANIVAADFGLPVTGGLNGFALQFSIDHFTMFAPTVISVGALPVKLIYFRGKNVNKTNVLSWATANEQNNYGFEVQRSSDSQNFTTIGFVRGADNSSSVQNYTFDDYKVENGTTYYRLKQIDTDKRFEYSTLIALEMNEKTRVKIYPTLVNDNLIVEGAANFEIVNNLGQIVLQNTNGENTISLQQLQSGIYFVRGTDEDGANFVQKIVKE